VATSATRFTDLQGQYLAFIHAYTLVNGRAPAEADMQRFFDVTPPSVHNMVKTLERLGLITRAPRQARSVAVAVPDDELTPPPATDQILWGGAPNPWVGVLGVGPPRNGKNNVLTAVRTMFLRS
jgi:hypothetical protein